MVLCMMENLVLDEGVTVEHVTFEISKHTSFKELELTSKDMPKCKGIAIFNHVLDPNIKWYARARALLSTGMTVWGNVDMFESTIDTENVQSLDMPSRISVPQITTTSDQAFHDLTMFTIQASGFRVIGNSTHYATSWIIEDSDGQVVWSLLKSSLYKEKLDVTDIILKANRVYRIKVIFHSSSNDVSPVGSYTIATMANDAIILTNYLDIVDSTKDLVLEINGIDGVKQVAWEIVNFAGNLAISTWKTVTDNTSPSMFKVTVPALTLKESDVYLIKISTDKKELGSRFIPFNTIAISTQVELEAAKEEKKEEEKALTEYELFKFNIFKGNTLWENSEEGRKVLEKIGDGERERTDADITVDILKALDFHFAVSYLAMGNDKDFHGLNGYNNLPGDYKPEWLNIAGVATVWPLSGHKILCKSCFNAYAGKYGVFGLAQAIYIFIDNWFNSGVGKYIYHYITQKGVKIADNTTLPKYNEIKIGNNFWTSVHGFNNNGFCGHIEPKVRSIRNKDKLCIRYNPYLVDRLYNSRFPQRLTKEEIGLD